MLLGQSKKTFTKVNKGREKTYINTYKYISGLNTKSVNKF